ncbi:MAG: hypothetical protein H0Z29_04280 [Candidatus Marinimicrobia bacterium]|nr:hypothetical protein [Candidatus Neomarinimicrobiota bacterium]
MIIRKIVVSTLFVIGVITTCCSKKFPEISQDSIIARIGNRVITKNEFIRRAEYTPRPAYCRGDYYIHKKIILNTLIAEKLYAIEAEKSKSPLLTNSNFNNYLTGRKEQAMRQWHYYLLSYSRIKLTKEELNDFYENSLRKYKLNYYTFTDTAVFNELIGYGTINNEIFERVFYDHLRGDSIPYMELELNMVTDPDVIFKIYSRKYNKGEIIGPIRISYRSFIIFRVMGWTTTIPIDERSRAAHMQEVERFLKLYKADKHYSQIVKRIMQGKRIEFNRDIFLTIAQRVSDLYLNIDKKSELNRALWDLEVKAAPDSIQGLFDDIIDEPLFNIDNRAWTVKEFKELLEKHPLVFRKRRFKNSEYLEQLKYAIVDLVRDYYITQDAYRRGYDRIESVNHNVQMWKDNLLAIDQRNRILNKKNLLDDFKQDYISIIDTVLNPYFLSLIKKYENEIEINTYILENIKLTRVDMSVLQTGLPYPVVVPNFPVLTTYNRLDYGKKMAN